MQMIWPTWKPLNLVQARQAKKMMVGERSPLELFLSPEPPRELLLHQRLGTKIDPLDDEYQWQIDTWSATRAWIYKTLSVPDHEGPILHLDVVFYVDEIPVKARFSQNNDAMHWAISDREHHDWFHALMKSKGEPVTVLFERSTRACCLFGNMRPYIFRDFRTLVRMVKETPCSDERRRYLYNCIDIVRDIEDADLVERAVALFGCEKAYASPDEWYRNIAGDIRLGKPVVGKLEPMLIEIGQEGNWFWAAD